MKALLQLRTAARQLSLSLWRIEVGFELKEGELEQSIPTVIALLEIFITENYTEVEQEDLFKRAKSDLDAFAILFQVGSKCDSTE